MAMTDTVEDYIVEIWDDDILNEIIIALFAIAASLTIFALG